MNRIPCISFSLLSVSSSTNISVMPAFGVEESIEIRDIQVGTLPLILNFGLLFFALFHRQVPPSVLCRSYSEYLESGLFIVWSNCLQFEVCLISVQAFM